MTIKGTSIGTITEVDGTFELKTTQEFPLTLEISYLGYETQNVPVSSAGQYIDVTLTEGSVTIIEVEVKASRISEDNKKTALLAQSKYHKLETAYQVRNFWQTRDLRDVKVVMEKVETVNEAAPVIEDKKPLYDLTNVKKSINKRFNK